MCQPAGVHSAACMCPHTADNALVCMHACTQRCQQWSARHSQVRFGNSLGSTSRLLAAQPGCAACLQGHHSSDCQLDRRPVRHAVIHPSGWVRGQLRGREGGRGFNRRRSHKQQAASRPPQRKAKRERQTREETRRKLREGGGRTPKARRSHSRKVHKKIRCPCMPLHWLHASACAGPPACADASSASLFTMTRRWLSIGLHHSGRAGVQ